MARKRKGQRADGLVEVTHTMPDGKRRHFYGATRAEAETKYQAALEELTTPRQQATEGPTFMSVANEWWDAKQDKIRHGTRRCYEPAVKRLVTAFQGKRITEIGAPDVAALLASMEAQDLATKTISNTHSVLGMIFEHAAAHYGLTVNPSRLISTPTGKKEKRLPPSASAEEAIRQALADAAKLGQADDPLVIAAVLLYTGCRRGEALALRFGDIDREKKRIRVTASVEHQGNRPVRGETKTESGVRTVPLLPQLEAILTARGWGSAGRYILGGGPEPLTNRQFTNRWVELCRRFGLVETVVRERKGYGRGARTIKHTEYKPLVTPHQFRHWYTTELYKARVPMDVAVRMMGHSDSAMIRRVYLAIDAELLDQAGETLAQYMASKVS